MAYVLLAVASTKNILDDIEYFTNKIRADVTVIKSGDLKKGIDILSKNSVSVLVISTTFESNNDGYKAVLRLRKTLHEHLPIVFYSESSDRLFGFEAFTETNCIAYLMTSLKLSEFEPALVKALSLAEKLKHEFFTVPQGASSIPISSKTFVYAQIRKGEDVIDVYEYDTFTGKKSSLVLNGISVVKLLEFAGDTNFVAPCYRGIVVGKKMIIGYDDGKLILRGGMRVSLGGTFEDDFNDYTKKI